MPAENKIQTQSEAEEKMVDLPDTGSSIDVDITDTKKTINPDEEGQDVETGINTEETASEGEMDDYGKKVQSRIDKLTKRLRELKEGKLRQFNLPKDFSMKPVNLSKGTLV